MASFPKAFKEGYFVTERQYIYYDADRAIFWLGLINVLPFYFDKIKDQRKQLLVMLLVLACWLPYVFPKKTIDHIRQVVFIL